MSRIRSQFFSSASRSFSKKCSHNNAHAADDTPLAQPWTDEMQQAVYDEAIRLHRQAHRDLFPLSPNLIALIFISTADLSQDQRQSLTSIMAHRNRTMDQYRVGELRETFIEMFCTVKTAVDNPMMNPSGSGGGRAFLVFEEGGLDGSFGYWAEDEEDGAEGYWTQDEWQGNENENCYEGWDEWQGDYYDEYGYFQGKGNKGKGKGKKGHGPQDQGKGQGEANYVNPSQSSQPSSQQATLLSSASASGFFVTHSPVYLTSVKKAESEEQSMEPDFSGCAFLG